ncbi:heavy-metal-associated domain-containing protein [Microbacterium sp. YJN-G]|uniref:heavy-metal-associated domain-containing protein n=1 Tax=Microbacterium sp. YJN-G TaxID=2763257 RepID=UPI001878D900|nr:heavy-metal-associated domain-containing protein [Microbacterium sp. YJN-G]
MTTQTSTTLKTTILRSDEFTCPSCVQKIESALTELDGVATAEVKFASGRIVVEHDTLRATVRDLVETVTKTGYHSTPSAF